jgi:hypothetical protein
MKPLGRVAHDSARNKSLDGLAIPIDKSPVDRSVESLFGPGAEISALSFTGRSTTGAANFSQAVQIPPSSQNPQ